MNFSQIYPGNYKVCFYCFFAIGIVGFYLACTETSNRKGANMKYKKIIKQYYQAYKDADKETLREILTPELKHISSFAKYTDRDKMIEDIWPAVGKTWAEELQIYGTHPEFMVRYKVIGNDRPDQHMAEYIRFKGEKITEIEVFIGRELD